MKTALLQCNPVTGDIAGNVEKIAAAVRRAGDVDLCVTPELALSGLNPGDYLSMNDFVEGCRRGLDILAETFKDGPDLLVGAPVISVYDPKLLSNAAVHIHGGTWEVVSRKIRHPASQDPEARFFDRGVSCGIMTLQGWRLGVVLCESDSSDEFWNVQGVGHNPLLDLISRGVDAIAYMTATPYTKDRAGEEYAILSHVAARHHVHLLCVNAVGGNDGLVYAGQSTAFDPTGALYARGKAFEEDVVVLDTASGSAPVAPDFASWEEGVFGALVLGTRDFVNKCGLTRGIVGLSGGIDSALVLSVGVEALGKDNVTAVLMPSPYSSRGSVDDAAELVKHLGVKSVVMPIEPVMKAFEQTMSQGLGMFETYPGDFTFENVQARIRGTLVTSLANRARALVLNTGNKSEGAMGYCTLYGDAVGALGVIADLTKTQVYDVAEWYNRSRGSDIIPRAIIEKAPSAELHPGQKDSDSLPPYSELDPIIETLIAAEPRTPLSPCGPRGPEVRARLFRSEFKRRQEPQPLYVSARPFGRAWSVPLAGNFRLPR